MGARMHSLDDETALRGSALDLLPALRRLDGLIREAVAAAQESAQAESDPFRGLHIGADEVERLLARPPGGPVLDSVEAHPVTHLTGSECACLGWLGEAFGLSDFDLAAVLIALAPEIDLRYERFYAFLQDDVTRRRPSVDLALGLLCHSAQERLVRRARFEADAPLIRHGLLHLVPDPNQMQPPLLAHYLKLDEQVVRLLLGETGLDPRLAPFCRLLEPAVSPDEEWVGTDTRQGLRALAREARAARQPLRLCFHGPQGSGKGRTAQALAAELGVPLLAVDLARMRSLDVDFGQTLKLLLREARLRDAILYLGGLDAPGRDEHGFQQQALLDTLAQSEGIVILASEGPLPAEHAARAIAVPFPVPGFAVRRACWQAGTAAAGIALDEDGLDALADRFRLTPGRIADAVAVAGNQARWRNAACTQPAGAQAALEDLFAAARVQSGQGLAALARKIDPRYTWGDIVLPADQLAQLREVCSQAQYRRVVYGRWGFERKLSLGRGINVLFSGPPGTGKTMAAEVIANELGLDLYKIDLSQVVSKYIGETEKNLDRIFAAAQSADAILFFDEADALFGKRSEVKDAHDRYANIEVGYLLQKMEEYEGMAILATNLRSHMDEAFVRRMRAIVEFPFPDEEYRRRIWEVTFPREAPLGPDVDFRLLAREVKLAGGNIRNIALAAAFFAAKDGGVIGMPQLWPAARREYQKLGRVWNEVR